MYTYGESVDQDYAEAMRWFRLAARQGYAAGQYNLGYMYRSGEGVARDKVSAYMWFSIADANGFADARIELDMLRVMAPMTPADIAEAQRRARACMASGYQDCD
jgi:TPR repeat protein